MRHQKFYSKGESVKVANRANQNLFAELMNAICKGEDFSRGQSIFSDKNQTQFNRIRVVGHGLKSAEFTYSMSTGKFVLRLKEKGKKDVLKNLPRIFADQKALVLELKNMLRAFFDV